VEMIKLTFDGEQHRTLRVNEAIRVFNSVKDVFDQKKTAKQVLNLVCGLR
jgi:hypothetical protein